MTDKLKISSKELHEEVSDYLNSLSIENMRICRRLRSLVIECMPGATEMVVHGALAYATSLSSRHRIVYIAPQKNWVNLGFFFGSNIPDPTGLLEGDGKRMRHIKLHTEDETENPSIAKILKAAWGKAPDDIDGLQKKVKK